MAVLTQLRETEDDDDDDDDDEAAGDSHHHDTAASNLVDRSSMIDLRYLEQEVDQFLLGLKESEASPNIGVGAAIDTAKLCRDVEATNAQHMALLNEVDEFLAGLRACATTS